MAKPFDPATATVEQLAAASRAQKRAKRIAGIVAAVTAAGVLFWVFNGMPEKPAMYGAPITIIAAAAAYWITYKLLAP
jgi:hypothetical protein